MIHHELRDPEQARLFLLQGLWLQRAGAPRVQAVDAILEWALEIAGDGETLPPIGVVADLGYVAFQTPGVHEKPQVPGWPEGLSRAYEDHVLGKLYADSSFERAGGALCHYKGRDRGRGLAFVVNRICERLGFGGVLLSPAVLKSVRDRPAEENLARGWEALEQDGPMPILVELYEELIRLVRQSSVLLGTEDVFEVEHRTAVAAFAQRVALRQVLQAAAQLEVSLPAQKPRTLPRREEVATRILDEDAYPVGGFSSISTRGSVESLLHSQLAYMEKETDRPDLFDIKFLRDELLYYSRDENQFFRRRRTFVFAIYPELNHARFKDPDSPWQRIVLLLGLVIGAVHKWIDWLSTDALVFEFLFVEQEGVDLADERALWEMIWREQIANGTIVVQSATAAGLGRHWVERNRRSQCLWVTLATSEKGPVFEKVEPVEIVVDGPRPRFVLGEESFAFEGEGIAAWEPVLLRLVQQGL